MDDGIKKCSSWVKAERARKAAPEMLKALLLWQEFCRMPPSFAASEAYRKAKDATDAAIAAATGE